MNNTYSWYQTLKKPSWAPPSQLFGPVWSILYIIIAITFGNVFYQVINGNLPWTIALPFALNLIFNLSFTPLQFGLKNNFYALIDIILTLITLIWALIAIWQHIHWIAYINIPYLLWVLFATTLQFTVTYLNKK